MLNHIDRSVTGCTMVPTFHPDYPIGSKVAFKFTSDSQEELTGKIVGVASAHVFFNYIILLDKPLPYPDYENWKAISLSGCLITRVIPDSPSSHSIDGK